MSPIRSIFISFLVLVCTQCGGQRPADSEASASEQGAPSELAYLEQYLGKRPGEVNMWATEPLHSRLRELLGEQYDAYLEMMQEAMPLAKDRVLYTIAAAPDHAIPGVGYLLVDTRPGHLKAYFLFGDYELSAQSPGEDLYLPKAVRDRVAATMGIDE
jgi:hypothetical protein